MFCIVSGFPQSFASGMSPIYSYSTYSYSTVRAIPHMLFSQMTCADALSTSFSYISSSPRSFPMYFLPSSFFIHKSIFIAGPLIPLSLFISILFLNLSAVRIRVNFLFFVLRNLQVLSHQCIYLASPPSVGWNLVVECLTANAKFSTVKRWNSCTAFSGFEVSGHKLESMRLEFLSDCYSPFSVLQNAIHE